MSDVAEVKLEPVEKDILRSLARAWNMFLLLPVEHPNERQEFLSAIHRAQALIGIRVSCRLEPNFWGWAGEIERNPRLPEGAAGQSTIAIPPSIPVASDSEKPRSRPEKSVAMYMSALEQLLAQGTAYLHHRWHHGDFQHAIPEQRTPQSEHLGWYDNAFFYLLPEVTYEAVCQFYRARGRMFPDTQRGVRVRLYEEGLLIRQQRRYTYRLRISDGSQPRVLRVGRPRDGGGSSG